MDNKANCRDAIRKDIELAIMTDPTPMGRVYVDLEGINPLISIDIDSREAFIARANRVFSILEALHGEFRADPAIRMRGMTFHVNPAAFTAGQKAAAREALKARLKEVGCPNIDRFIASVS